MNQKLLFLSLIVTIAGLQAQAHDAHNWKTDKKAFASVEIYTVIAYGFGVCP